MWDSRVCYSPTLSLSLSVCLSVCLSVGLFVSVSVSVTVVVSFSVSVSFFVSVSVSVPVSVPVSVQPLPSEEGTPQKVSTAFCLKAKATIRSRLSYMCHIRSTADVQEQIGGGSGSGYGEKIQEQVPWGLGVRV